MASVRRVPDQAWQAEAPMVTGRPKRRGKPRIGVVFGAGGVLGAAWMAGALVALQERIGHPVHAVDVMVGTSAGSVLAAAVRCGVPVDHIVAHQRGIAFDALPHLAELDRDSGILPPLPRFRLGSVRLLAATARAPHRIHPRVAASALLPQGRAHHRSLTQLVRALLPDRDSQTLLATNWPAEHTWIVCVDYEAGRRVVFGREGAPMASLPDAVVASCSIPGWHEPKLVGERRYIDGGVRSPTSLDLLAKVDLDEVYVLAPLASFQMDKPRNPATRTERLFRHWATAALTRDMAKVEASGARVIALTPGPVDLDAMGYNLMDWTRRQRVLETSLVTSPARLATIPTR
jgi:NTE family protein